MFRCACPATTVASHGHLSLWSRRCSALAGPGDALFAFLDVDRVRIFFEVDYSTMRSSGTRLMRATAVAAGVRVDGHDRACGAYVTPDESGRCQYCGASLPSNWLYY